MALDGYEFRAVAYPLPLYFGLDTNITGWKRFSGIDGKIQRVILRKMNATISLEMVNEVGYVNWEGKIYGVLANMTSGAIDLLLNSRSTFNKQALSHMMTYPHMYSGMSIISRPAGYQSAVNKILQFMNPKLVLGLLLVAILSVVVLKVSIGRGFVMGSLTIMRIATNAGVDRGIRANWLRIYLISVILVFLITNATFQGNLAAILTSPVPKPNIDNLESLKDSGQVLYFYRGHGIILADADFISEVRPTEDWNCSVHVVEKSNAACLGERFLQMKISRDNGLYVSKENVIGVLHVYLLRPDWPLKERFNSMLKRLMECGLVSYWVTYFFSWTWTDSSEDRKLRKLGLQDVGFSFLFLVAGLITATLAFLAELLMSFYTMKYKKR